MPARGGWKIVEENMDVADETMSEGNDRTSGSSTGQGPPPPPPAASGLVLPLASGTADDLVLPLASGAAEWCSATCHWCCLRVSTDDHGKLHKAQEAYVRLLAESVADSKSTIPKETKTIFMNSMKMVLMACAWHTKKCNDSPSNQATFQQLQGLGWIPPHDYASMHGIGVASASAGAADPAEQASTTTAGGSKRRKPKARAWWNDDMDAEWRKEPWVLCDAERKRTIQVMCDGKKWVELDCAAVQTLLAWYDRARLGDVKKGVGCQQNGRAYDYKIEGGKYLTQNNPNFPESNPRPCQILYVGASEPEDSWESKQDNSW